MEKRIDLLVAELRSLKTKKKRINAVAEDIKTGANRYKIVSDYDYNLIFELLSGWRLEDIEREQVAYEPDPNDLIERLSDIDNEDIERIFKEMDDEEIKDYIENYSESNLLPSTINEIIFSIRKEGFKGLDNYFSEEEKSDLVTNLIEQIVDYDYAVDYIKSHRNELVQDELDRGNYVYETNVLLKSSDGYKLCYYMGWTEGMPETGCVQTPYNS